MCGIAGWLDYDIDMNTKRAELDAMSRTLSRRGPDESGEYTMPGYDVSVTTTVAKRSAASVYDITYHMNGGSWVAGYTAPSSYAYGTGATLPDGRLAVVGGVNREIFAKALHNGPEERIPYLSQEPAWYRFRQAVYLFDGKAWQQAAAHPFCALAGPGVAAYKEGLLIAGGECKPGVRSPRIFCIKW